MEHSEFAIKEFRIGTDVEFVPTYKIRGSIRPAHDIVRETNDMRANGEILAIGRDGDRDTASMEFRPGASKSAETLVDNLYDLIKIVDEEYHPPGIIYRTGAFVHCEPLGGHLHLSWKPTLRDVRQDDDEIGPDLPTQNLHMRWVQRVLHGWRNMSSFLVSSLYPEADIIRRVSWAKAHHRDFAFINSIRPRQLRQALYEGHVEYRYPPSWLLTPEHAYCFLGGAEVIVRHVLDGTRLKKGKWNQFIYDMFNDEDAGIAPPNSPNLARAFKVASQYKDWKVDFIGNWR